MTSKYETLYWADGTETIHFAEMGDPTALCGYKPRVGSGRWHVAKGFATGEVECPACATEAARLVMAEANSLIDKGHALKTKIGASA